MKKKKKLQLLINDQPNEVHSLPHEVHGLCLIAFKKG